MDATITTPKPTSSLPSLEAEIKEEYILQNSYFITSRSSSLDQAAINDFIYPVESSDERNTYQPLNDDNDASSTFLPIISMSSVSSYHGSLTWNDNDDDHQIQDGDKNDYEENDTTNNYSSKTKQEPKTQPLKNEQEYLMKTTANINSSSNDSDDTHIKQSGDNKNNRSRLPEDWIVDDIVINSPPFVGNLVWDTTTTIDTENNIDNGDGNGDDGAMRFPEKLNEIILNKIVDSVNCYPKEIIVILLTALLLSLWKKVGHERKSSDERQKLRKQICNRNEPKDQQRQNINVAFTQTPILSGSCTERVNASFPNGGEEDITDSPNNKNDLLMNHQEHLFAATRTISPSQTKLVSSSQQSLLSKTSNNVTTETAFNDKNDDSTSFDNDKYELPQEPSKTQIICKSAAQHSIILTTSLAQIQKCESNSAIIPSARPMPAIPLQETTTTAIVTKETFFQEVKETAKILRSTGLSEQKSLELANVSIMRRLENDFSEMKLKEREIIKIRHSEVMWMEGQRLEKERSDRLINTVKESSNNANVNSGIEDKWNWDIQWNQAMSQLVRTSFHIFPGGNLITCIAVSICIRLLVHHGGFTLLMRLLSQTISNTLHHKNSFTTAMHDSNYQDEDVNVLTTGAVITMSDIIYGFSSMVCGCQNEINPNDKGSQLSSHQLRDNESIISSFFSSKTAIPNYASISSFYQIIVYISSSQSSFINQSSSSLSGFLGTKFAYLSQSISSFSCWAQCFVQYMLGGILLNFLHKLMEWLRLPKRFHDVLNTTTLFATVLPSLLVLTLEETNTSYYDSGKNNGHTHYKNSNNNVILSFVCPLALFNLGLVILSFVFFGILTLLSRRTTRDKSNNGNYVGLRKTKGQQLNYEQGQEQLLTQDTLLAVATVGNFLRNNSSSNMLNCTTKNKLKLQEQNQQELEYTQNRQQQLKQYQVLFIRKLRIMRYGMYFVSIGFAIFWGVWG